MRPTSPPDPERGPARPRGPGRLARALSSIGDGVGRVIDKAGEDNIFFLAGAIAFNVLVAIVPLVLAVLGIGGTLLALQDADPTARLVGYLIANIPPVSPEFERAIRSVLLELVDKSTGLLSVGMVVLIWIATRLVGTLRTVLREVFDIQKDRGIIAGKLFDIKMVLAAGTLFAVNVGLTVVMDVIARYGFELFGLGEGRLRAVYLLYGRLLAFLSIWVMFVLIYRYLPGRVIQWRTALVAATFTAILFEVMKQAFSWYVTNVANYGSTYGNLATLFILIFWIYYSAVAFVLGGEVAQVVALRRIRRRQIERLR